VPDVSWCEGYGRLARRQKHEVKPVTDPDVKSMTEEKMVEAVRNGMGKMQPYKDKLTDAQIKDSVGHFRTFLK
jgi:hypothetical protein